MKECLAYDSDCLSHAQINNPRHGSLPLSQRSLEKFALAPENKPPSADPDFRLRQQRACRPTMTFTATGCSGKLVPFQGQSMYFV